MIKREKEEIKGLREENKKDFLIIVDDRWEIIEGKRERDFYFLVLIFEREYLKF